MNSVIIPIPPRGTLTICTLLHEKKPHHADEVLDVQVSRDLALLTPLEESDYT